MRELAMYQLMLAAGGGSDSPVIIEVLPLITAVIVFGTMFVLLAKYIWPRITQGLEDRDRKIKDEIESAEDARKQAKNALEEYERELANARHEAADMIAKARADAKAIAEELRSRNEVELTDMKQRATQEIDAAKQAAINELYAEASTLAVTMAGKILKREISVDDQERLMHESLQEMG